MSDTSGSPRTSRRRPRSVRRALVAVVSTLGLAAAAAAVATPSASASAPPPPSGWNQVFVDDFDLATLAALRYAKSLRPTTVRAVHFVIDSEQAERLRAAHPSATVISAGMSGDLEQAIACGATHVRIGTALLGGRGAIVR